MLLRESNLFRRAGPREKHLTACIPPGFLYLLWQHSRLISSSNHMAREKMRQHTQRLPDSQLQRAQNAWEPEGYICWNQMCKRQPRSTFDDNCYHLLLSMSNCCTVPPCLCLYHRLTYYLKTMCTQWLIHVLQCLSMQHITGNGKMLTVTKGSHEKFR